MGSEMCIRDSDNQGVVQLMAQGAEASPGQPQDGNVAPVDDQLAAPEKNQADATNDDLLAVEDVDRGDAAENASDA